MTGAATDTRSIRACKASDAARICEIYNHYIRSTIVTFEEEDVAPADMAQRIDSVIGHWPWFVVEENGSVAGYAYASRWKARSAYRFAVESTVYLAPDSVGRGIGTQLYRRLIDELQAREMRCVIGGISLPNLPSIALHEKLGFEKIGQFREVGWKFGQWIDVGYWQRVF